MYIFRHFCRGLYKNLVHEPVRAMRYILQPAISQARRYRHVIYIEFHFNKGGGRDGVIHGGGSGRLSFSKYLMES